VHRRHAVAALALVLALAAASGPVLAHVPAFSTANDDPGNATYVADPTKSWSFYDRVEANESAYYRTYLNAGDRLLVNTFTPRDTGFEPGFVVMSPALNGTAGVPPQVEVPDGYGARVVEPTPTGDPEYEPFTPAALFRTSALETTVDTAGTYYVAVYEPDREPGPVGVVIGSREAFTIGEYLSVPFDRLRIHEWEGQPSWFVYGPVALGALATLLAYAWWTDDEDAHDSRSLALAGASACYGGGAAGVAVQTAVAIGLAGVTGSVVVTLAFLVVPAILGWYLLGRAIDPTAATRPRRGALIVVAAVGVLTWAGFLLGPALAVFAAFLPAE
jgi:hypothetical protein